MYKLLQCVICLLRKGVYHYDFVFYKAQVLLMHVLVTLTVILENALLVIQVVYIYES